MRLFRSLPRHLLWWLMLALLGAQTLGIVHGARHGGARHAAHALVAMPALQAPGGDAFGHHPGDAECRLYDQLAHGDEAPPLPSPDLGCDPAATDGPPRWMQRAWQARLVRAYGARAPPAGSASAHA